MSSRDKCRQRPVKVQVKVRVMVQIMPPTTALRAPENYGLRGWILAFSRSGPAAFFKARPQAVRRGRMVTAFSRSARLPLGDDFEGSANGMKMSRSQIGRRLLGLAVGGVALAMSGAAFAEMGQPAPWEYRLQEAATPVMEQITWFHNVLFWLITIITLFVLVLLVMVVVKFNARTNPVPSRTTHNTLIEVAWTLIPVLILVGIAVPSFRLLFQELDIPK